jgi:Skp family chaperone for outer membrane proteins
MQRTALTFAIALCVGIGLLTPTCPAQPHPAGDHLLAIGVIRMGDVMRQMQEMKKFDSDRRARLTEFQQQQQQREMALQELQKHRDNDTKQGSQQWTDETNIMDQKLSELDGWEKVTQMQLERWQKTKLKEMYDHISAAAAQVAEQQHLDLVIADQSPDIGPDMDKVSPAKLEQALSERTVLFANKKADITTDVLTMVDTNFMRQGAVTGPQLPAPGPVAH